ncbi:MAG: hypothetical protein MZV63_46615 [Marinilabiliales bacterium]|nr:hypothetical protein [Marinilabiliales bacterium]
MEAAASNFLHNPDIAGVSQLTLRDVTRQKKAEAGAVLRVFRSADPAAKPRVVHPRRRQEHHDSDQPRPRLRRDGARASTASSGSTTCTEPRTGSDEVLKSAAAALERRCSGTTT